MMLFHMLFVVSSECRISAYVTFEFGRINLFSFQKICFFSALSDDFFAVCAFLVRLQRSKRTTVKAMCVCLSVCLSVTLSQAGVFVKVFEEKPSPWIHASSGVWWWCVVVCVTGWHLLLEGDRA